MIPFKKINLGNSLEEIRPLIESGMIGLGGKVFEFEQALAEYVGSKYCVALDSCTSALFLSIKWQESKTVIIPSMTVPLVVNACYEAGKEVKFDDNVDWVGSAYQIKLTNVWDSAHQLERNQYKNMGFKNGEKLCFSFYPTKNIGSADGGAVCTDDKEFADWARMVSCYGRNQQAKYGNSWDYDVEMKGYKRHYTNLQSVICLEQLKRLDETNAKRTKIRDTYNNAFGYNNTSLYLYRLNVEDRDNFIAYMKEHGVECGVHFKPLHLMKPFVEVEIDGDKSKIESNYKTTVSLPFFDLMTDEQVNEVIDVVKNSPFKIYARNLE